MTSSLLNRGLFILSTALLAFSSPAFANVFVSWEDEYRKNAELFKSASEMEEFWRKTLDKRLSDAIEARDEKRRDFYSAYIAKIRDTRYASIQLSMALQMAMRTTEDREFNAWLMSTYCDHTPAILVRHANHSLESEKNALDGWARDAKIPRDVHERLKVDIATMFKLREWYQRTCSRAANKDNWRKATAK